MKFLITSVPILLLILLTLVPTIDAALRFSPQYNVLLPFYNDIKSGTLIYSGSVGLTSYIYTFGVCYETNCSRNSCSGVVNYQLSYDGTLQENSTVFGCRGLSYTGTLPNCRNCPTSLNYQLVVTCIAGPCSSNGGSLDMQWDAIVADDDVALITFILYPLFPYILPRYNYYDITGEKHFDSDTCLHEWLPCYACEEWCPPASLGSSNGQAALNLNSIPSPRVLPTSYIQVEQPAVIASAVVDESPIHTQGVELADE